VKNYRPIYLTSAFSKIFETVICNRIKNHLAYNKVISQSQHGFLRGKSTLTALSDFLQDILHGLDNKENSFGIFCDLSKAFDSVNHSILLNKLYRYGIRGKSLSWLESYLLNRTQIVEISHTDENTGLITKSISSPVKLKVGVPQGSVLGPLMFLIYINDLPQHITQGNTILYADDTNVLIKSDMANLQQKIDTTVSQLENWFQHNKLKLNSEKTKYIYFHKKRQTINATQKLSILNKEITCSQFTKFLGVILDEELKWKEHIDILCGKLSSTIFLIRSLVPIVNRNTILTVYHAMFESQLRYGLAFWGYSPNRQKPFLLQKQAIRTITGMSRRTSCKRLFRELNILTFPSLYIYEVLLLTYNNTDHLKRNYNKHEHYTRHNQDLSLPYHKTTMFSKSQLYMGIKFYNDLPVNIKHAKDKNTFKSLLRKLLIEKCFYSVEEFSQSGIS